VLLEFILKILLEMPVSEYTIWQSIYRLKSLPDLLKALAKDFLKKRYIKSWRYVEFGGTE